MLMQAVRKWYQISFLLSHYQTLGEFFPMFAAHFFNFFLTCQMSLYLFCKKIIKLLQEAQDLNLIPIIFVLIEMFFFTVFHYWIYEI